MLRSFACNLFLALLFLLLTAVLCVGQDATEPDSSKKNPHLHRNLIVGNVIGGTAAYFYLTDTWGTPTGRFHFKEDTNDNLALTDEISHMFAGYQLTEAFICIFRLLGMDSTRVEKYAMLEAGLVTTLVEFPLDAYNPGQGFGATDFLLNWMGIGFSWLRRRGLENFDLKFALKRSPFEFENKFLSSKNEEFDNFVWWALYKPKYIWLGVGYGTNHDHNLVESEYYLGVGTTLNDLLYLLSPATAKRLKALDTFFINLHIRL
ncbi:MAG: DUF2279 domain-containing protein [candidate division Zixibacteria bacterium]|nr:DUF2279 domain-containing protein [candidate division Zixibacteria bacterium]